jgi:2-polyprenyl-3-methyl-5-hydroxy-6-metoxy-1,4-benzoquinol methylase
LIQKNKKQIKRILSIYEGFKIKTYIFVRLTLLDFYKIANVIPDSKKIIDAGCGYGVLSFILSNRQNTKIQGYDLDEKRINYLNNLVKKKRINNLKFYEEDVAKSKFKADTIVCVDLIHHLNPDEQKSFLNSINKMSKKGAIFVVKDMNKGRSKIKHYFNRLLDLISTGKSDWYYHDENSFRLLFKNHNFKIKSVKYINKWYVPLDHILFVLEKK